MVLDPRVSDFESFAKYPIDIFGFLPRTRHSLETFEFSVFQFDVVRVEPCRELETPVGLLLAPP
jgi:hypothetical protein